MRSTRHVLRSRLDHAANVLTAAFTDDPVMNWIFPGTETDPTHLHSFMSMAAVRSHAIGHAYELTDGDGVALWCPPEVSFYNEAVGTEFYEIALAANGPRVELVLGGLSEMSEHHPEEPHFYLPNIGVAPSSQGKGNGAVLLDRVLNTCDDEGLIAFLESSNPRNVSLYERAGFEVTAEIHLPEGPVMRPMVRQPQ